MVWKGFAKLLKQEPAKLAVVFNNVEFLRKTVIPADGNFFLNNYLIKGFNKINFNIGQLTFVLSVLASGEFELKESNQLVASGQVSTSATIDKELLNLVSPKTKKNEFLPLKSAEVYKELRLKGYDYKDPFRGIQLIDNTGKHIIFELFHK